MKNQKFTYLYVMLHATERRSGSTNIHYMSFTKLTDAQAIADSCHNQHQECKIEMNIYRISQQDVHHDKNKSDGISWNNGFVDSMTFYSDTGRPFHHVNFGSFDYTDELRKEKLLIEKNKK